MKNGIVLLLAIVLGSSVPCVHAADSTGQPSLATRALSYLSTMRAVGTGLINPRATVDQLRSCALESVGAQAQNIVADLRNRIDLDKPAPNKWERFRMAALVGGTTAAVVVGCRHPLNTLAASALGASAYVVTKNNKVGLGVAGLYMINENGTEILTFGLAAGALYWFSRAR